MTGLARFRASNHPQQVRLRGPVGLPGLGLVDDPPEVDDRTTPADLFAEFHKRFAFSVDAAASHINRRLPRYWTREEDGLAQSWAGERVWCNPPYSDLPTWVRKARAEAAAGTLVVMIVPANRTEQDWWQDEIEPFRDRAKSSLRVEFLRGRIRFIQAGASGIGPNERPPFGCALLIWNAEI